MFLSSIENIDKDEYSNTDFEIIINELKNNDIEFKNKLIPLFEEL
jgi:hypothetical protein